MKIAINVIADCLKDYICEVKTENEKQFEFSGIRQMTGQTALLRQDVLYVCDKAISIKGREDKCAQVCVLIKKSEYGKCGSMKNAIVIKDDVSLFEIFDKVLGIFEKTSEFTESLQSAIIFDSGIDKIFSLASKNLPGCLLVMTDTAYNIVHSTEVSVGDAYLNELLQRGYYDKNDIDMIANRGYFEDWQRVMRPKLYVADETVSGKNMLLRSYQSHGLLLGFVACYFLDREPSELDYVIFKSFTDSIERMMLSYIKHSAYETSDERMLSDMLSVDNMDNAQLLRDRGIRLGLPQNANYRIGVIRSEDNLESIAASVTKHLLVNCPIKTYGVYKYKSEVILVFYDWNYYSVKETSALDEKMQLLISTLKASRCGAGISLGFNTIESFPVAYKQACSALNNAKTGGDAFRMHFYSEYCLQDMLSVYSHEMPLDAVYAKQLDALKEGKFNECDNLTFLYIYLRTERNIAATARLLNMHRNGAIYRVNKIIEHLGLDLDDADTRLRIMLSYEILKKLGRFSFNTALLNSTDDKPFKIHKD